MKNQKNILLLIYLIIIFIQWLLRNEINTILYLCILGVITVSYFILFWRILIIESKEKKKQHNELVARASRQNQELLKKK